MSGECKVGVSPDLNAIAGDLVPSGGGHLRVRLLEFHRDKLQTLFLYLLPWRVT